MQMKDAKELDRYISELVELRKNMTSPTHRVCTACMTLQNNESGEPRADSCWCDYDSPAIGSY